MFSEYVTKAMEHAVYELLEDGTYYGEVPELEYTWANAKTLEACRTKLREIVEGWLMISIAHHDPIPALDGVTITVAAD